MRDQEELPGGREGSLPRHRLSIAATVGLLVALGLAELMPRRTGNLALWGCGLGMFALAAIVPFHYIKPAYARPPLLTAEELAQVSDPVSFRFGESIELAGYDVQPDNLRPGELVTVSLYWRCLARIQEDYSVIVQTLDPNYSFYGGVDTNLGYAEYPTSQWQAGGILKQTYQFRLGASFPSPAFTRIKVAVYATGSKQGLPAFGADGRPIEGQVTFGRLRVAGQMGNTTELPKEISATFGDAIHLRDYRFPAEIHAGGDYPVTLYWESFRPVHQDYTVFVHLVNEEGKIVAQADGQPRGGGYPTALWVSGEVIEDTHQLTIASTLKPGRYRLLIGLYLLDTLERLPASDKAGQPLPANQFVLSEVRVAD